MNDAFDPREAAKQAAQQRIAQQTAAAAQQTAAAVESVSQAEESPKPSGNQQKQAQQAPVAPVIPVAPVVPVAPVASPMTAAEQMNAQLLQILIQQQARLAAKDHEEEERKQARDKQRERNAQDLTAKDLLRQARCSHLKGGRRGPRSQVRDYAVYMHTFIDNKFSIKCFLCKMEWKVKDTIEFLFRKGKKVANHTKMGWFEASKMLEQTTNTPSSSEVPGQTITPLATPEIDD